MSDRFLRGPRPPVSLTAMVTAIGILLIAAVDYAAGWRYNLSVLQSIPLLICAYARNRKLLWVTAAAVVIASFVVLWLKPPPDTVVTLGVRLTNRCLLAGG